MEMKLIDRYSLFTRVSCLARCKRARFVVTFVSVLGLSACGSDSNPAAVESYQPHGQLSAELQQRYDETCGICHGVPGTGAPAAGDVEAWTERGKQGIDALLDHAISGYRGMPPMGLCMDCTQADLQAMIEYMSGLECE